MEYQKTNVNAFAGLNVNKRPEMLPDSQASDMENLRFDKLGYLINRNGVLAKPLRLSGTITGGDTASFLWPIGTMGMTEYILKAPWGTGSNTPSWAPYDDGTLNAFYNFEQNPPKRFSDRFMVSFIRIPTRGNQAGAATTFLSDSYNNPQRDTSEFVDSPDNHYTWRYKGAYVIMPLFGPSDFRDTFAFLPNGFPYIITPPAGLTPGTVKPDYDYPSMQITIGARSILRADDKPKKTQIYAPSRWLGVHNTFEFDNNPKDANWIDHYVSMNQYRDSIIISDTTNGDLQLVDEYSEAEYTEERKHRFTLRENALAPFDVDDVVVDFGIGGNNFNEGVEAPMALYKFYLPKKNYTSANDKYKAVFNGVSKSPTSNFTATTSAWNTAFRDWRPLDPDKIGTFFAIESIYSEETTDAGNILYTDRWQSCGFSFNSLDTFTYANGQANEVYSDVFSAVTLANPDILDDDQVSSDVYLWDDFEIKYYPSSGATNAYGTFLTGKDRVWNKTSSASSKIVKLKTKAGVEQEVPLGVWRYRFVWYMGNGEYSAPSAELVVPDLLFSGLKDSDISGVVPTYRRPIGTQSQDESISTAMDLSSNANVFINDLTIAQGIKIFQNDGPPNLGTLTAFGQNFVKLKKELYNPDHRFAALKSSTNGTSWPTSWDNESYESKGNLATICTVFFNSDDVVLNGVIGETAHSQYTWKGKTLIEDDAYKVREVPLVVPIFPRESEDFSYNSLATESGVIRTIYQNRSKYQSSTNFNFGFPAYDIIFTNATKIGGKQTNTSVFSSPPSRDNGMTEQGGGVYINVVALANAFDQEKNNSPDDELYSSQFRLSYRNMTQTRAVKTESDRISILKQDIPTQVVDRILLSGACEITVCDFGDTGTWRPQESYSKITLNSNDYDILDREIKRAFLSTVTSPLTPSPTPAPPSYFIQFIKSNDPAYSVSNAFLKFQNLKVVVAAPAERLLIQEQLSMYVPASLLFEAPHVKLVIPSDRIPRRARQLMIFRTRASHDNAWQPHEYGLVKALDITRDSTTGLPSGDHQQKISFLDDIKTSDLDFSYNLADFDGFVEPIKSRFSLPLNERVFYANIRESYRPLPPRNAVRINADPAKPSQITHKNLNVGTFTEIEKIWSHRFILGDAATTNVTRRYLYYFVAYNDAARSYSLASFSSIIDRGILTVDPQSPNFNNAKKKVILFCLPSAYNETVEHLNIYRLQTDTPLATVPFGITIGANTDLRVSTNQYRSGIFYVAQGLVEYNGIVYYPNSVIKAFDGGDTGVPGLGNWNANPYISAYLNRFVDYFSQQVAPYQTPPFVGKTNRGPNASYCTPIIYDITAYFDNAGGNNYIEKIGDIKPEDEGIFYDDDLPALGRLPLLQFFQNEDVMPAGLRWSEPYQPNKIKLGSIAEVRSGDGDQITGIAQLYGNIIVLKERSIHRLAVQGAAVPISRVDEISNNVGCIAPNTVITVDNSLYFLSWSGFYKYDNNVLTKIDGEFAEELQVRLRSNLNGVKNPAIRDASCGWNPTYRELYLNIPVMSTDNNEGHYGVPSMNQQDHTQGITLMDNVGERDIRGSVYAINMDTNFVTKHRYMDDALYFTDPSTPATAPTVAFLNAPTQRSPRVSGRLYYTNTLGQLRSSEILPPRTYNYNIKINNVVQYPFPEDASISYLQTAFFIESPTKEPLTSFDKYQDDFFMFTQNQLGNWQNSVNFRNVRVFWSSKSWTNEDKSTLKRVRKVFTYVSSSVQPVVIRGITHTSPLGPRSLSDITWQYSYFFSDPNNPAFGQGATGELLAIPTEAAGSATSPSQNRGERHTFQVEGGGAFQMEYFGFYWKPVNPYQR